MVVPVGSLPWSDDPRRSEKNGSATSTTTTRATRAGTMGRAWTKPAHLGQNPLVPEPTILGPLVARSRFWRRLSTRGPMNERKAGRRVSAAIMVNSTPSDAAMARP